MSDNTQHAIVVQTCAKIAAEILIHAPIADCEGTLGWWKLYFHEVLDEVTAAIGEQPATTIKSGRAVPVLRQDEMQMKLDEYTAKAGSAVTGDTISSEDIGLTNPMPVKKMKRNWDDDDSSATVTIKGGEVPPAWLIRACAKEGVTEVFNNSKAKEDNPARPDYCATTPGPDGRNKGFWAPKVR